jgi:GntR family transcriptional repressor for pyruvate dehydrogenase complex
LRLALEKLAVEFAVHNTTDANHALLLAKVEEMRQAIADGDASSYASSDFAMHQLIWQQSGNPYLIEVLSSMIGPIFLFISSQAGIVEDWQASLQLHEHLVETIATKDVAAAVKSMEDHVLHSLDLALQAFKQ